jgi:NADPH-dependent 7-cyano-7-deazaguanine reductase QueF
MIGVQPNLNEHISTRSRHTFDLPRMCPVSGNPQPGSVIAVYYTARRWFLEIETLGAYIASYIGGRAHAGGLIRDMEQTIQQIAQDCAASLEAPVTVVADLKIADDPDGRTRVRDYRVIVRVAP